jgi:hypothetical protein
MALSLGAPSNIIAAGIVARLLIQPTDSCAAA